MIVVERATEEDLLHLLDIDQAAGHNDRGTEIAQAVQARRAYIARREDAWLGFALVNRAFFGQSFIELIVVHPQHRRRGVASALVGYIARTNPSDKLFTSTNQSNTAAQALFEQLGFERSGVIENLDDGDPEIIYFKRLTRL